MTQLTPSRKTGGATQRILTLGSREGPAQPVSHLYSIGILPLDAAQAKKQTFVRALDFQMSLATKSQPSNASTCAEQKLMTGKDPLELSGHTMSSLFWAFGAKPPCQQVRLTNYKYYPLPNH